MFKWVEGSSEDENFLKGLLSYLDDEIKGDNDENIASNKWQQT